MTLKILLGIFLQHREMSAEYSEVIIQKYILMHAGGICYLHSFVIIVYDIKLKHTAVLFS